MEAIPLIADTVSAALEIQAVPSEDELGWVLEAVDLEQLLKSVEVRIVSSGRCELVRGVNAGSVRGSGLGVDVCVLCGVCALVRGLFLYLVLVLSPAEFVRYIGR